MVAGAFVLSDITVGRAVERSLGAEIVHARVVATIDGQVSGAMAITATSIPVSRHRLPRLPVVVTTGGVMGSADHLAPLLRQDDDAVLRAMLEAATKWRRVRFSCFHRFRVLPEESVPGFVSVGSRQCPRGHIADGADWQSVQAAWSQNRRKKIRQRSDRFAALGGWFEWLSEPHGVLDGLDVVIELHRQRWTDQGHQTQFGWSQDRRQFLRDVVMSTSDGSAWVQLAKIDDTPVGDGFSGSSTMALCPCTSRAGGPTRTTSALDFLSTRTPTRWLSRAGVGIPTCSVAPMTTRCDSSHTVDEATLVADGPFAKPLLGNLLA